MRNPPPEMTRSFLIQLVFCKKQKTMWFIGIEVEQETSAPPPKKNPGSAPVNSCSPMTTCSYFKLRPSHGDHLSKMQMCPFLIVGAKLFYK